MIISLFFLFLTLLVHIAQADEPFEDSPYGVCGHLGAQQAQLPQNLQMIRAAGIRWVRTDFTWKAMQPDSNTWNFDRFDNIVAEAEKNGVRLLPILDYDVPWATPAYKHLDKWTEYVEKVVSRYKDKIRHWEVWNEENVSGFWRDQADAENYTLLLEATYKKIKEIDPNLVVLYGGTSGIPMDYIEKSFQAGAGRYFDVLCIHPYNSGLNSVAASARFVERIEALKQLMSKYDLEDKKIWITEMGWSTAPMLFQTGHAVFRAAKAKLDPASPKWTVAALLDENYRATPSFSKNSYLATVPKDFDIEFIKLPDLKNLDPAKYQALVFPPSEKYPTPYIDSIVDYVDRGGHLFLLGGIPFYYQMEYAKESPDELIVKQNGTPGVDRRRFRIAWQTSWSDKTKKTPETAKVVVAPDFRELLKNDPVAGRTKAFLNDKLLGTGDRFIPILLGKEGNFEAPCAAIFQYGDRKGTVVASTIAANEVLTEEDQAAFLPQVILLSRFAGIERFLWYEFRAVEQAVHDKEQFFGIVHRDLKPKPAYLTYTALTRACPDGSVIDTSIPWNRGDFCAIKWMRQDGTSCWAVWAPEEKKTISVKISGKVQAAFDCFGTDVSITEKTTTLEIGRNVLYLIGPTSLEFQVNEIAEATTEKPNVVIIFTDDQGYADVGCYGAKEFKTPHLDQLAREGRRFTNFYVAASVCTPSRAALLTGCYPQRIGLGGFVFFPTRGENPGPGPTGLHPNEITIAEMLKQQGYATACIGKWHLGDAPPFLPTRQGFDEYFGLPYSNDMRNGPNPPLDKRNTYPPLPLYDGEKIIETEPDQTYLTRRYTERAVDFIERHRDQPFFLYLPHTMPHVPLHVHSDFKGKSEQGLYGDVIQEIDWSVGRILQSLKNCGIDEKTWVIFTSDNGPWLTMGKRGGSALPLRDGKQSKYDGGHRVPCLMRFPGQIKAGTVGEEMIASIDLFPTIAKLCGGILPRDRTIDGMDAWDYFSGATERSPRKVYFYNKEVVRQEKWKLFLPGNYAEFRQDKMINPAVVYDKSRLYDLDTDIAETTDVSEQYPNVVRDLKQQLKCYAEDLRLNTRPLAHAKDFTE